MGYEDAGQLTEAIRRRPYSIVVFDEIEKAHPEAFNILLQIMEEGHLSDAKGHVVDFRNAIIIMTSNVGAETIQRGPNLGFSFQQDKAAGEDTAYEEMRKKLLDELKRKFRPEFINRVDSVIVFRELTREDILKIVDIMLEQVNERLADYGLRVQATPAAKEWLSKKGYDPEFGARPLRRVIQTQVEDRLSDAVLSGRFSEGDTVTIDAEDEKLVLSKAESDNDNGSNGAEEGTEEALPTI